MPRTKKTKTADTDTSSYKEMDQASLQTELNGLRKELFALEIKHSVGELKQPHLIRMKRRDVARVSTYLSKAL